MPLRTPGSSSKNSFGLLFLIIVMLSCAAGRDHSPPAEVIDQLNQQRTEAAKLIEQQKYPKALKVLENINRRFPGNPETLGLLAWAQWHTGNSSGAVANFENSIRGDYSNFLTHLRFAQALLDLGKSGRALTEFKVASELGPNEPLTHYNYGLALYRLDRKEQARAAWQRAYDLDSDNPVYIEAMGLGLTGRDDKQALVYFEKAYALGRSGPSFCHNYAQILERLGQDALAEKKYLEAVELAPDRLNYRFDLAAFYMNTGSFESAVQQWRYLVDRRPEEITPRLNLARAFFELGRYSKAIDTLDPLSRAVDRPDSGRQDEVYGILAMSYRGAGHLDKANLFIKKALALRPDHVDYLINYGVILADRGMMDQARVQWLRALKIDPDNLTAQQNLSAIER